MARVNSKRITSIGGSALIEGIMMRGPKKISVAVRMPDNTVDHEEMKFTAIVDKHPIFKKPMLRGVAGFIDSMRISYKALMISADKALTETEEEKAEREKKEPSWLERKLGDKIVNIMMIFASIIGVVFAVGLFMIFPSWLYNIIKAACPVFSNWYLQSAFEGILRIVMFLLYIILCSQTRDMKRVFMYHGAEHKTITCYENEEELTVENARKYTRFHPRCGTSFMVIMLIIGIVVGFFIHIANPWLRGVVGILIIPLVVGFGYEVLKLCGKHDNKLTRILSAPGIWAQHITTKEPDDEMLEVAIAAMKDVIPENGEDIVKIEK